MSLVSVKTEVAFASDPGSAPSWTDISSYVRSAGTAKSGRQRELDLVEASTLNGLLLDNADDRFNPDNASGPYYPNVYAMRRIRERVAKYPVSVIRDQPYGYWRLIEDSATIAIRDYGSGRHAGKFVGGLTSAAGTVPGEPGGAATFDGSSEYVDLGTDTALGITGNLTIEAVIKRTNNGATHAMVVSSANASTNIPYSFYFVSGSNTLRLTHGNAATNESFASTGTVSTGAWHHVAVTRSGTAITFYIDGVAAGTATATITPTTGTTPRSAIGANALSAASFFLGSISEVAVYKSALSAAQIAAHSDAVSVLYDHFDGFVEDWPPSYEYPRVNVVSLGATDGFLPLAAAEVPHPLEIEIRNDSPVHWWALSEEHGSTTVFDSAAGLTGDTNGTAIDLGQGAIVPKSSSTSCGFDAAGSGGAIILPGAACMTSLPFTLEFVWNAGTYAVLDDVLYQQHDGGSGDYLLVQFEGIFGHLRIVQGGTIVGASDNGAGAGNTAGAHHAVVVVDSGACKFYIDGVDKSIGGYPAMTALSAGVQAALFGVATSVVGGGLQFQHVVTYDGAMSAGRVAAHYAAFQAWQNDLTGARIGRILDAVGWPAADRDIDTGISTLQSTGLGASALEAIRAVEETENGVAYMSPGGKVTFRDRHAPLTDANATTSQATFTDDGSSNVTYSEIEPDYAIDLIYNVVRVSRDGGHVQESSDATSVSRFFRRVLERTGQLQTSDAECQYAAQWLLQHHKDQKRRYGSLMFEPYGSESVLLPHVFERSIGDRITVTQTPPGGSAVTFDCIITGREVTIDDQLQVRCQWQLIPADAADGWWILNTSALNSTTRLSY